jgi:hypothetical protein
MPLPSRRWLLTLAATALAGSLPGQAAANDRDLRATTVPAALCVEGGSNGAAHGGVWLNEREYGLRGRSSLDYSPGMAECRPGSVSEPGGPEASSSSSALISFRSGVSKPSVNQP